MYGHSLHEICSSDAAKHYITCLFYRSMAQRVASQRRPDDVARALT